MEKLTLTVLIAAILIVIACALFGCQETNSTKNVAVKNEDSTKVEQKDIVIKKRYFLIGYSYKFDEGNGQGSMGIVTEGFFSEKNLIDNAKKQVRKSNGFSVNELIITSISELSEKDYNIYTKK